MMIRNEIKIVNMDIENINAEWLKSPRTADCQVRPAVNGPGQGGEAR
jgi:hypothetical protein